MLSSEDLPKLEKFTTIWQQFLAKPQNPLEFLLLVIEYVGQLYKASKVTFYVFDKRFQSRMIKKAGKNSDATGDCEVAKMILES